MFNGKNVFCLILARGGSKGVPRKNVRIIGGKPLIVHTIEQAKKARYIDETFVSTEDKEIQNIAEKCGATVINRPSELATDDALYIDGVKHLIGYVKRIQKNNPTLVMLSATNPLRQVRYIEKAIENFGDDVDCVVDISKVKKHPSLFFRIADDGILESYLNEPPISNRQEAETLYEVNGGMFITSLEFLKKQKRHVMGGRIRGYLIDEYTSVDIDTEFDFEICRLLIESRGN